MQPILRKRDELHVRKTVTFRMRQRQLYFRLFRFSTEYFDSLLSLLRPFITKHDTAFRQAVPADMWLSVTLLLLATGDSLTTLSLLFRTGKFQVVTWTRGSAISKFEGGIFNGLGCTAWCFLTNYYSWLPFRSWVDVNIMWLLQVKRRVAKFIWWEQWDRVRTLCDGWALY